MKISNYKNLNIFLEMRENNEKKGEISEQEREREREEKSADRVSLAEFFLIS